MQRFSATDRPPRRGVAPARAVAARHGDRAAGDGGRARPRLGVLVGNFRPRFDLAGDRVGDLAESLVAVAAHERVAVRQRGHHARGPYGERVGADARVDPHDAVGEAREARHLAPDELGIAALPSETITTTAPRAMPRRPWRSLNVFSASPTLVPLDQSGAAAAA